ncbi:MAG TPA: PKD domain-containing protein, partial [Phycisphaerae bacterium]|nr:PKD domain-containing protein [Phycisphaerae bacterium]
MMGARAGELPRQATAIASPSSEASGAATLGKPSRPIDASGLTLLSCSSNQAPTANAGDDLTVPAGTSVSLSAAQSYDMDGDLAAQDWDFGDGEYASGVEVDHIYATPGTYTITLSVMDDCGETSDDTVIVQVTDPNVVTADFVINPNPVDILAPVTFTAVAPTTQVKYYLWSFSDGGTATGSGRTVSRTFSYAGTYTATLKVIPKSGSMLTHIESVSVSPGLTLLEIVDSSMVNLPRGFAVVNGSAWASGDVQGLSTADVAGPDAPLPVETSLAGAPWHIAADSVTVAVASTWGGVYLYRAAQPDNLSPWGRFDTYAFDGSYAYNVALNGDFLYVACYSDLKVVDISDPSHPTFVRSWTGTGSIRTVDVIDGRAYVYDTGIGGIHVLDLLDPTDPFEVGSFATLDQPEDIAHNDSLLAIAEGYGDLEIFDFSDPDQP